MPRAANQVVGVVSLTDADGSLTPTLRVSAGGMGDGQTLVCKSQKVQLDPDGWTDSVFHVVSEGATFYITDIYVGADTAVPFTVTILVGTDQIFNGVCKGDTAPINLTGIQSAPSVAAGGVVELVISAAAGTLASYMINGYEEIDNG